MTTTPATTTTTTTTDPQTAASTPTTADPKAPDAQTTAPTLANPDPAKPADGKPSAAATAAPEAYAAFRAPDGYTLDPKAIEAVAPIFKELGLTQDQAQKLVDAQIARDIAAAKAPQETYANLRKDWQTQTLSHPEIKGARSGEHNGIDAVKAEMGKALNAIGDPALASEFKAAMDLTGAGDHPAFVRTFLKLASFVTEGTHVSGRGPSTHGQVDPSKPVRPTPAQSMYPNLPSAAG